MGSPDRAPRRDREPRGAAQPVQGRAARGRSDGHGLTPLPRCFRFVQWEWPGRLGPPPGRYVVRRYAGDAAQSVVVVGEGTAPRRVGRRERPEAVPVTRVTVVAAEPLDDAAAAAWLRAAAVTGEFTAVFERLVAAFRVAAADPYLADLDPRRAWRTRIGFGSGEQVAAGEWADAREVTAAPARPSRAQKRAQHRPADRLAALLAGRDVVLAAEELTLRARLDLDRGRALQAATQLEAALTCALAELGPWADRGDLSDRLVELETHAVQVRETAAAARAGALNPSALAHLAPALERLEAALRARALYSAQGG